MARTTVTTLFLGTPFLNRCESFFKTKKKELWRYQKPVDTNNIHNKPLFWALGDPVAETLVAERVFLGQFYEALIQIK